MRKIGLILLAVVTGGFLLLQLVPYGRNHTNPPVASEPDWNSPETRALTQRACFDCHSNETVWPWYSHVAPVSWMVQNHVEEGRARLNFSEWGSAREGEEGEEMAESIFEGKMPEPSYLITHTEARLSEAEKQALADGLLLTGGGEAAYEDHESGEEREHEQEHEEEEHEDDD